MADLKISQLASWTPLDTDLIPFVDLSWTPVTKKATRADLKGDNGAAWANGVDWINWNDGTSATATVWTTTTWAEGSSASVVNSWTTSAAIFDFTIPKGDTGAAGAASTVPWPTWNWIANIALINTVGLVKTYRVTYTDASTFDYTTSDWASGSGTWDMLKVDNLSGLTNTATARTNLSVDSSAEVDVKIWAVNTKVDNNTTSIANLATAQTQIDSHLSSTANPHSVTATQVWLGSVDDTADTAKPVSTAQQTALDGKEDSLWNPATDWQVLSSTTGWVRSWVTAWGGGGGEFPINIYVSNDTVWVNSSTFTFTHNLGLTETDVLNWRYKVILTSKYSTWAGWQYWDTNWNNIDWGGNPNYAVQIYSLWTAANPSATDQVRHQTNSFKIFLWTTGANLTNFKAIIQQMY